MTTPEDAIRARRRLTNKLIASHEAARLKRHRRGTQDVTCLMNYAE